MNLKKFTEEILNGKPFACSEISKTIVINIVFKDYLLFKGYLIGFFNDIYVDTLCTYVFLVTDV